MPVKNLFGTSGVRGIIGQEIDNKFAYKIGRALGRYLKKGKAVIALDPRPGADDISHAVMSGLSSSGIKVDNLGIMSTPELTWYQVKRGYNLAISVTGSHLPWNMIGIIPTLKNGQGIFGKVGEKITQIYGSL